MAEMIYRETVESIGSWSDETFGAGDPNSPARCLRLLEEVVELCYAAGAGGQQIAKVTSHATIKAFRKWAATGVPASEKADEMADCAIVLATIAHQWGLDLDAYVASKMKTNRESRKWVSNGDGTGQHKEG